MSGWDEFAALGLPKIAAVRGLALGGGCELAMMCDLIIAGEDAQFGQPELALGLIPGLGATQRLTRAVGKARAMDLILTGRRLTAAEAFDAGLVSRVVPSAEVLETATAVGADPIAAFVATLLEESAATGTLTAGTCPRLSNARRSSEPLSYRMEGCFSSSFMTMNSSSGGMLRSGARIRSGGADSAIWRASSETMSPASKGSEPLNIS